MMTAADDRPRSGQRRRPGDESRPLMSSGGQRGGGAHHPHQYDGPQSYEVQNPDQSSTRIQVLQVTESQSKTDDFSDSDQDIPTLNTGDNSEHRQQRARDPEPEPEPPQRQKKSKKNKKVIKCGLIQFHLKILQIHMII